MASDLPSLPNSDSDEVDLLVLEPSESDSETWVCNSSGRFSRAENSKDAPADCQNDQNVQIPQKNTQNPYLDKIKSEIVQLLGETSEDDLNDQNMQIPEEKPEVVTCDQTETDQNIRTVVREIPRNVHLDDRWYPIYPNTEPEKPPNLVNCTEERPLRGEDHGGIRSYVSPDHNPYEDSEVPTDTWDFSLKKYHADLMLGPTFHITDPIFAVKVGAKKCDHENAVRKECPCPSKCPYMECEDCNKIFCSEGCMKEEGPEAAGSDSNQAKPEVLPESPQRQSEAKKNKPHKKRRSRDKKSEDTSSVPPNTLQKPVQKARDESNQDLIRELVSKIQKAQLPKKPPSVKSFVPSQVEIRLSSPSSETYALEDVNLLKKPQKDRTVTSKTSTTLCQKTGLKENLSTESVVQIKKRKSKKSTSARMKPSETENVQTERRPPKPSSSTAKMNQVTNDEVVESRPRKPQYGSSLASGFGVNDDLVEKRPPKPLSSTKLKVARSNDTFIKRRPRRPSSSSSSANNAAVEKRPTRPYSSPALLTAAEVNNDNIVERRPSKSKTPFCLGSSVRTKDDTVERRPRKPSRVKPAKNDDITGRKPSSSSALPAVNNKKDVIERRPSKPMLCYPTASSGLTNEEMALVKRLSRKPKSSSSSSDCSLVNHVDVTKRRPRSTKKKKRSKSGTIKENRPREPQL